MGGDRHWLLYVLGIAQTYSCLGHGLAQVEGAASSGRPGGAVRIRIVGTGGWLAYLGPRLLKQAPST